MYWKNFGTFSYFMCWLWNGCLSSWSQNIGLWTLKVWWHFCHKLTNYVITNVNFLHITELKRQQTSETIVITGGTRGIGAEVVKKLLICNKNVILGKDKDNSKVALYHKWTWANESSLSGCQYPSDGNKLIRQIRSQKISTGRAECHKLELMSLESVRQFAQKVLNKDIPLHCLINNGSFSHLRH